MGAQRYCKIVKTKWFQILLPFISRWINGIAKIYKRLTVNVLVFKNDHQPEATAHFFNGVVPKKEKLNYFRLVKIRLPAEWYIKKSRERLFPGFCIFWDQKATLATCSSAIKLKSNSIIESIIASEAARHQQVLPSNKFLQVDSIVQWLTRNCLRLSLYHSNKLPCRWGRTL